MANRVPGSAQRSSLLGRDKECALLDELVAAIRQGESRSLVLRGEAGVGKTALLQFLIDSASDLTPIRASGVESEMELPYAALHQLCTPMLHRLEALPPPQRQALEIPFGLGAGTAPDRFLVGLAVLSLFSDAAQERPLLCVIDDAQWLDDASAVTLAFVARRLVAESVGLVFAARENLEERSGLPELVVQGLADADARELLASVVRWPLDERVREQLLAEARGNPLALLELPRGRTPAELAGGFGLANWLPLPGKIEESFLWRLQKLRPDTRLLLLVAAAEPTGDSGLMWRAASRLDIPGRALAPAVDTALIEVDTRVRFRHPLVRSALYRAASSLERQRVHAALAEATDAALEPDRRVWHRAQATPGADEEVAAELEHSAGRAQTRGGLAAAAAFMQRAVALTETPSRRTQRALDAAEAGLNAGTFESALALLAVAEAGPLDALQRARLELLQAHAAYAQRHGSDAPPLLLRAAKTLEPLDARLARETYLDAWTAALFAGRFADACTVYDVSRAARSGPPAPDQARPSDLLLDGLAILLTDGRSAATRVLQEAAAAFAGDGAAADEVLRWGWLATIAAVVVWDYESCLAIAARGVQLARDLGALSVLPVALNIMAQAVALGGEFGRAAALIAEADAVIEATGTQVLPYAALYLSAYRGREDDVAKLVAATVDDATASGQGNVIGFTSLAQAVVANGRGRYADAVAPAEDASNDIAELVVPMWGLIELVEAAARSGNDEMAQGAIDRLAARNDASANDWGLGIEARSRAFLTEGDAAENLYREAIERLGRTQLRPELARAHLLYGEWLRRTNRRADARDQLRAAYDQLSSIGMEAFAERARRELQAIGDNVRKRTLETHDELTAHERQIADLACDGLSNPEIGARLFLSPRTVEWHLRRVFGKLGIQRRRELANALARSDSELRPA